MNPVYQGDAPASTPSLTSDVIARELLSVKWTLRPLYKYILNFYATTGGCFLLVSHWLSVMAAWGEPSSLSTLWRHLRKLERLGKIRVVDRPDQPHDILLLFGTKMAQSRHSPATNPASRGDKENPRSGEALADSHKHARAHKRVAALTPPAVVQEPKGSFEEIASPSTQVETPPPTEIKLYQKDPPSTPDTLSDTPDEDAAAIRAGLMEALADAEAIPYCTFEAETTLTPGERNESTLTVGPTDAPRRVASVADDVQEMQAGVGAVEEIGVTEARTEVVDDRQSNRAKSPSKVRFSSAIQSQTPSKQVVDNIEAPATDSAPNQLLLSALLALGVTPTTAARMVNDDPDEVRRQLASPGLARASNGAAWVVAAVKGRWRPTQRRQSVGSYAAGHVGIEGRARVVVAPREWRERFEISLPKSLQTA